MKFSSQEEYGLRCLIRIGRAPNGLTIPEISEMEGLSTALAGKLLRLLRLGGFIDSSRGQSGGYKLSRPADEIVIGDVLAVLGGKLFEAGFCDDHAGAELICTHTVDCSIRSLWRTVQNLLDSVLGKTTLHDLLGTENEVKVLVNNFITDEEVSN
jgi:Rrf2 family protein